MRQYVMTKEELMALHKAVQTPGVFLGGVLKGFDPAKTACEELWKKMGEKYRFDWKTVQPVQGQPQEVFEAKPMDSQT